MAPSGLFWGSWGGSGCAWVSGVWGLGLGFARFSGRCCDGPSSSGSPSAHTQTVSYMDKSGLSRGS